MSPNLSQEIADELKHMAGALGMEAGRIVEVERLATERNVQQIYIVMLDSGAPVDVLSAIGSWGDTFSDDQVLAALRMFNREGTTYREIVAAVKP